VTRRPDCGAACPAEDAPLAFLLATPVILAAGALNAADLSGHTSATASAGRCCSARSFPASGRISRCASDPLPRPSSLRPFGVYGLMRRLLSMLRFTIG